METLTIIGFFVIYIIGLFALQTVAWSNRTTYQKAVSWIAMVSIFLLVIAQ